MNAHMRGRPLAGYWRRYRRRYWGVAAVVVLGVLASGAQSGRFAGSPVVAATDAGAAVIGGLVVAAVIALAVALVPARHHVTGEDVSVPSSSPLMGQPRVRRWGSLTWRHIKVLALCVAVLALAVGADVVQANREMGRLVSAAWAYQGAEWAQDAWADENMPDRSTIGSDPKAWIATYAEGCAHIAGSLSNAVTTVEDVWIIPWHSSLRHAKAALLRYANARMAYFDACTSALTSPTIPTAGVSRAESESDAARAQLADAFADAKPRVTLPWWGADRSVPYTE